jgi:chromate transporter
MKNPVSFGEAFRFWLKLGFISFGGPAGQIAIMQKDWSKSAAGSTGRFSARAEFLHAAAGARSAAAGDLHRLAAARHSRRHRGGRVFRHSFDFSAASAVLRLRRYGNVPQVSAVLDGFKAVVVAIVVEAVFKIAKKASKVICKSSSPRSRSSRFIFFRFHSRSSYSARRFWNILLKTKARRAKK